MSYFLIPLISFLAGGAGAWFMSRYAYRLGIVDLPNERSSHSIPTPRGGGIGILAAFVLAAVAVGTDPWLWAPAALLALISFFDDRLGLSPRVRLLFQFGAAFAVILPAVSPLPLWQVAVLLIFWSLFMVGTTNFFNFMDGINGIAGITGAVVFGFVAVFAWQTRQPEWAVFLALGVSFACLGFLPFNLPRAKVFMGDVGSVLLGFVFAGLVYRLTESIGCFLCLSSALFMFYADALTTLFIRWRAGEKLSQAHRRHLYQVLANERGIPHWQISIGYGAAQLAFSLLMTAAWRMGILAQLLLCISGCAVFSWAGATVRRRALRGALS